jgi:hypothetical protein
MTEVLCPIHPDANAVEAYAQAFDDAWQAMEEAIAKAEALNDTLYQGEILVHRVPAADASLMRDMAKKLRSELDCFEAAREPSKASPILPGEVRYQQLLRDACLR